MKDNKRKQLKLFTTYPPQRYFILLQFGIFLATLVFLLSIMMSSVSQLMEPSYSFHSPLGSGEKLNVFFDHLILSLFIRVSLLFAVAFFVSVLFGLFFLERLTGPLIRIKEVLEDIGHGEIPESGVRVREGDYPNDLARALSNAIAYLNRKKMGK